MEPDDNWQLLHHALDSVAVSGVALTPATPPEDLPLLLGGGALAALAAARCGAPMIRGVVGERKVRRFLRRHRVEALHGLLLPRADGKGWTQVDHLVRLPDRILVLETKNLRGRLVGGERDATWTQRFGRLRFPFLNPLWQNALHLAAVRALVGPRVRVEGMVVMVGRGWFGDGLPDGCYRLEALGRRLRQLQRREWFGAVAKDCLDAAWRHVQGARSHHLMDRYRHGAAVERARGTPGRRATVGLAYAIGAGAMLGLVLAG